MFEGLNYRRVGAGTRARQQCVLGLHYGWSRVNMQWDLRSCTRALESLPVVSYRDLDHASIADRQDGADTMEVRAGQKQYAGP